VKTWYNYGMRYKDNGSDDDYPWGDPPHHPSGLPIRVKPEIESSQLVD
jgi:hypothetical protein